MHENAYEGLRLWPYWGLRMSEFDRMRRVALSSTLALGLGLSACAPQTKTGPQAQAGVAGQVEGGAGQTQPLDTAESSAKSHAALSDALEVLYRRAMVLAKTDTEQATGLFESAAMQGHGEAAYQLGLLQTDAKRQVEWHSMAAAVGQVDAQYALGEAYLNGRGTAKEPAWGLSWFERAARAGHAGAQYAMGVAMATSLTGPTMREEALVWLLIATKNRFQGADLMVAFLQARLSSSAWAAAQERAKAWTNEPAGDAEARATTRFAQHALGRLGFDAGLADGIQGERTDKAVSAFRVAQGISAGVLYGRTLDLLRERLAVLNR